MKKRVLSLVLAALLASMMLLPVSAAETVDLGSIECAAFWSAHTAGVKIEDGATVKLTMDAVMNADKNDNWCCPFYVVFANTAEAKVNEDDKDHYTEYAVVRADQYGWFGLGTWVDTTGHLNEGKVNDTLVSFKQDSLPSDWEAWRTTFKSGAKWTVTVKRDGDKLTIVDETNTGSKDTTVLKIDASKDTYIAIGGEYCKANNVKAEVTPKAANVPQTGDSMTVVCVLGVAVLALVATVASKKKVTE